MAIPSGTDPPGRRKVETAWPAGKLSDLLQQFARNAGPGARLPGPTGLPADVEAEERRYQAMHREGGVFKPRDTAPGLLVSAARVPGEVARTLLTIACYVVLMILLIGVGGDTVQRVPGVFQVMALFVLVIPARTISTVIWNRLGARARDRVRLLVRFWPLTLLGLILLAALLQAWRGGIGPPA